MSAHRRASDRQALAYRDGKFVDARRNVPDEVPVALSFMGSTYAVLMATPDDLEDFAVGFCVSEGIVGRPDDISACEVVTVEGGLDIQIRLVADAQDALTRRRRAMAGPVGCGLCGIESIGEAVRDLHDLSTKVRFSPGDIARAVHDLSVGQSLNRETRAVHGVGFYVPGDGVVAVREDVGRHNALDKTIGAALREGRDGSRGAVVVTSRVSVEMVQKTAMLGSGLLIAISAPTRLALDVAERCGMTIAAVARGRDFELMTHPERVTGERGTDVA